jgi:hypothetical protein
MINFIVFSPGEYSDIWGGVVVLHTLADTIAKLGESSYIYASSTYEGSKAKVIPTGSQISYDPSNTVVIYPEVTFGNPLQSKNVVRWLLYTPGVNGGDGIYQDTDLIYKFFDSFDAPDESKVKGLLHIFRPKFEKFYNKNLPREGECYIVKKGKYKTLDKHAPDSTNIDNFISDEYLIDLFNRKETFVCYDPYCFHTHQAALCGCIPVVIPDDGVTKEDFIKRDPGNKYGVAYGFDDIENARKTIHLVKPNLEDIEKNSIDSVKKFIEDCYEHLNIKK